MFNSDFTASNVNDPNRTRECTSLMKTKEKYNLDLKGFSASRNDLFTQVILIDLGSAQNTQRRLYRDYLNFSVCLCLKGKVL